MAPYLRIFGFSIQAYPLLLLLAAIYYLYRRQFSALEGGAVSKLEAQA